MPAAGDTGRRRSAAPHRAPASEEGVPLPPEPADDEAPPEDEEAMLAEAATPLADRPPTPGVPDDPGPEQAALELLTVQLGARAIDRR